MGFFDKMFGGRKDYPELDPASPVAGQLERMHSQLEELSGKVHKPLEVIPGEEDAFVFIGKPPKDFGIAWIEGDRLLSFKNLVEERGIDPKKLQPLAEKLRQVYEANQADPRYTAKIGGHDVVVTPSDDFRRQVREIIREATH
jgi:hypothetical protein